MQHMYACICLTSPNVQLSTFSKQCPIFPQVYEQRERIALSLNLSFLFLVCAVYFPSASENSLPTTPQHPITPSPLFKGCFDSK